MRKRRSTHAKYRCRIIRTVKTSTHSVRDAFMKKISAKFLCLEFKKELLEIVDKYENIVLHDDEAYSKLTVVGQ